MDWQIVALRGTTWYKRYAAAASPIQRLRLLAGQPAAPDDARSENGVAVGATWWAQYRAFQMAGVLARLGGAAWLDNTFYVKSGGGSAYHAYGRAEAARLPHFACDGKHAKYAPDWAWPAIAQAKAARWDRVALSGNVYDIASRDAWMRIAALPAGEVRAAAVAQMAAENAPIG